MDVRSHPSESSKRHCPAGAGLDRSEREVAWADLLDEHGVANAWNRRRFESAIRERMRAEEGRSMSAGDLQRGWPDTRQRLGERAPRGGAL